jgi:hypothetical protein
MAAVPAVPAAEIAALAFLAEHSEMDVVLTLCGFEEPIAHQCLSQREGFDTLELFGDFSNKSIDYKDACKLFDKFFDCQSKFFYLRRTPLTNSCVCGCACTYTVWGIR